MLMPTSYYTVVVLELRDCPKGTSVIYLPGTIPQTHSRQVLQAVVLKRTCIYTGVPVTVIVMASSTTDTTTTTTTAPTREQWDQLCQDVKAALVKPEMGEESWYLIIVSGFLFLFLFLAFRSFYSGCGVFYGGPLCFGSV